eukprot:tig00001065_g6722.t1
MLFTATVALPRNGQPARTAQISVNVATSRPHRRGLPASTCRPAVRFTVSCDASAPESSSKLRVFGAGKLAAAAAALLAPTAASAAQSPAAVRAAAEAARMKTGAANAAADAASSASNDPLAFFHSVEAFVREQAGYVLDGLQGAEPHYKDATIFDITNWIWATKMEPVQFPEETVLYAMAIASALVYFPFLFTALARVFAPGGYDLSAPRAMFSRLPGWAQRATWAHQNAMECLPPFLAAATIAYIQGDHSAVANWCASMYCFARALYPVFYMNDSPVLRSAAFALGQYCTIVLFLHLMHMV